MSDKLDYDAELKRLGCPYDRNDFRAQLWLEGYKAGFTEGHKLAAETAIQHFTIARPA